MRKRDVVQMIDDHKNGLTNPIDLLNWTWLRVLINEMPDADWERHLERAAEVCSK